MPNIFEQLKPSLVRLHHDGPGGSSFGTGVFVARDTILTARHVLDPQGILAHDTPMATAAIRVESSAYAGRREPDRIHLADADVDLALAVFSPSKSVPATSCCSVRADPFDAFSIGDEADVLGYESADGDLQMDRLRVLSVHPRAGAYICNKAVPRGYSGGPVFIDGGLVGVMYARNHDRGQAYFYGVGQLLALLADAGVEPRWLDHDLSGLRAYPLGPGIGMNEVLMRLHRVIDDYLALYQGDGASQVIARANAARYECGPDTGNAGLIELHLLASPYMAPHAFWNAAFVQAGLKSPRMLAALLGAVDHERLSIPSRQDKTTFLAEIRSRPH